MEELLLHIAAHSPPGEALLKTEGPVLDPQRGDGAGDSRPCTPESGVGGSRTSAEKFGDTMSSERRYITEISRLHFKRVGDHFFK